MKVLTPEETNNLLLSVYRRGVLHGGMFAVCCMCWLFIWR
jgi:hypothetical protein